MLICQVKKNQYQKKLKWMRLLLSFWLLFLSEITQSILYWNCTCYIIRYIRLFLGLVWPEPKYFLKSLNEIRRICLLSTSKNQWIWSPKPHLFLNRAPTLSQICQFDRVHDWIRIFLKLISSPFDLLRFVRTGL